MKSNKIRTKLITLSIVLILAISFNLSILNVSSAVVKNDDDGIWYDEFNDATGIEATKSEHYEVSSGYVRLSPGADTKHDYDFNDKDSKNRNVHSAFEYSTGTQKPTNIILRGQTYGEKESFGNNIDEIQKIDGRVARTESAYIPRLSGYTYYPLHFFKFKTDFPQSEIQQVSTSWWYGPYDDEANVKKIVMYMWYNNPKLLGSGWRQVGSLEYTSSTVGKPDGDLTFTIDDKYYVDDEGYVRVLIIADYDVRGKSCILTTDYVNLSVVSKVGYSLDESVVVSTPISPEPSKLDCWDTAIWSCSRSDEKITMKIQVLDDDYDLIDEKYLPGNKNGFTLEDSPLDISSIPTSIKQLHLKATFQSKRVKLTPRLYSWGITWHKDEDRFRDSFSSSLRLETLEGAHTDDKIVMDMYHNNWPIMGNKPDNTRSYSGYGPNKGELYSFTDRDTVGGGFRAPILSDGIIYIASNDGEIFAYSGKVPTEDIGNNLDPIDESDTEYAAETSLAASAKYIIVAEGEINQLNRVIALNKLNLSEEKWTYTPEDIKNICYSAAPTIANGKVFVTSWHGLLDSTVFEQILSSFDFFLKKIFMTGIGVNNNIIALDLETGEEIWKADLPSASFSTPAVKDGVVYVACQNLLGDTLYAFNEDSGEELWSAEVGLLGPSSPVVYNDKVYVVGKQNKLRSTGDVNLIALDKETGEQVWNQTTASSVSVRPSKLNEKISTGLLVIYPMSTVTPAIYKNRVYVTTPNGEIICYNAENGKELWSDEFPDKITTLFKQRPCISPVVADDIVYVGYPQNSVFFDVEDLKNSGVIYSYSTKDEKDKKPLWSYVCSDDDPAQLVASFLVSSPIVSDGILYISPTTNLLQNLDGSLLSIGNKTENQKAKVVSNPINLPDGKWWQEFNADFTSTEDNTIKFSILDLEDNVLESDLDGDHNNLSHINKAAIKLEAQFLKTNTSQDYPVLNSWTVTWTENNNLPKFVDSSFTPDPSGWINTNTPVCTVKVSDQMPGLDVSSARYKITYKNEGGSTIESSWIEANCTGKDGSTDQEKITCDISKSSIANDIKDLLSITISIQDLAGYEATITKTFQKDTEKPTSYIENRNSFDDKYNEEINISAKASDSKSGIKHVILKYRYSDDGKDYDDWEDYGDPASGGTFKWLFGEDMKSGYYQFVTIAVDKAGNTEKIDDKDEEDDMVTLLFDIEKPDKPVFDPDEYVTKTSPEFDVEFVDDYELVDVYYLILGVHGNNQWQTLEKNIEDDKVTIPMNLTKYWDDMKDGKTYYVYFKVTDLCGNIYETPSNSDAIKITKDTSAGNSYVDTSDFKELHMGNTRKVVVTVVDEDDVDKVTLYYRYSKDNETWGNWEQYGDALTSSPFGWDFEIEKDGYYEFKTTVKDLAGNIQESPVELVQVSTFPVLEVAIIVVILVCLLVAVIVVVLRRKKIREF